MADREKVIKGLMHCTAWSGLHECQPKVGDDCPYEDEADCQLSLMRDALVLLKEQEPRVLTRDEIIGYSGYIWKEYKGISCMNVAEIRYGMELMPYAIPYPTKELNWEGYCKEWRCWSAQPTEEQRKAVKWDE